MKGMFTLVWLGLALAGCGESPQEAIARRASAEKEACVSRYASAMRDGRMDNSVPMSRWTELCSCAADRLAGRAATEASITESAMSSEVLQCIRTPG